MAVSEGYIKGQILHDVQDVEHNVNRLQPSQNFGPEAANEGMSQDDGAVNTAKTRVSEWQGGDENFSYNICAFVAEYA